MRLLLQDTRKFTRGMAVLLLLAVLCVGCASSERMTRMSGDVIREYALPSESRILSDKYSALAAARKSQANADSHAFSLWPLFYHSDDYTSVLWPMIDSDPYGFAFRPFYNHEGDDHSVLFPLSAWNTHSRSGWVLNTVWDEDGFTVFPLVFTGKDHSVVLPLWYHVFETSADDKSKDATILFPLYMGVRDYTNPDTEYRPLNEYYVQGYSAGLALLAFYGKTTYRNLAEFDLMFSNNATDSERRAYLTRVLGSSTFKLPENADEREELRKTVFGKLNEESEIKYGFFPLFSRTSGSQIGQFSTLLGLLTSSASDKLADTFDFRLLPFGLLYSHSRCGDDSSDSILWRLWRRTKCDGKTGGYIFFIPYGDVH